MNQTEFESKKHEDEVRLREEELKIRRLELETRKHSILSSPFSVAFIAGLFALVGAILTAAQGYSSKILESERAENLLIQKFIEMAPNRDITIDNLIFLSDSGLISEDKSRKLSDYLEKVKNNQAPMALE